MRRKLNLAALALSVLAVSYFSLIPVSGTVSSGESFLPVHGIAYFVVALGLLVNFHDTDRGHLEAVFSAFLLGLFLEFFQFFVPGRVFSFRDLWMNLAGAGLVLLDHRVGAVPWFIRTEDRILRILKQKTGL